MAGLSAATSTLPAKKTGHVDLSEREHVQVHLTRTATEAARLQMTPSGLFVGKPVVGKVSGKATIQLSRSISYGTSRIAGLVVASVNPGYFEDVYRDVQLGKTGIVTLVGNDPVSYTHLRAHET